MLWVLGRVGKSAITNFSRSSALMPEIVGDMIAEFDAFDPSDDSIDNEERLQILIDRWVETPDGEQAVPAMLQILERSPRSDQPRRAGASGPCNRRGAGLQGTGRIAGAVSIVLRRVDGEPHPQQRASARRADGLSRHSS